jgi:hypothetical protein
MKAQRGSRGICSSSTLSLTSALDRGGWSTPRPDRFTPGNDPVPIIQEAGYAPGVSKAFINSKLDNAVIEWAVACFKLLLKCSPTDTRVKHKNLDNDLFVS